jgi:hypothetical protein
MAGSSPALTEVGYLERFPFDLAHGSRSSIMVLRANYPVQLIPLERNSL